MTVEIESPDGCPECGGWVCLEYGGPAAFHCGTQHNEPDSECEWRQIIPLEPGEALTVRWRVDED